MWFKVFLLWLFLVSISDGYPTNSQDKASASQEKESALGDSLLEEETEEESALGDSLREEETEEECLTRIQIQGDFCFDDLQFKQRLCSTPRKVQQTQKQASLEVETGVLGSSLFDISADLATNNEALGTSFKNETSDIPYPLGSSLLAEDGHEYVANELGASLDQSSTTDSEALGTSLNNERSGIPYTLGCSLLEEDDHEHATAELGTSVGLQPETDVFDPDFICNIHATPKQFPRLSQPVGERHVNTKLLLKALDMGNIKQVLKSTCSKKCGNKCVKGFTRKEIHLMRQRYWTKSRYMRDQFILQTLRYSTNGMLLCDNGQRVCRNAFSKLLRINKNRLTVLKKKAKYGAVTNAGCSLKTTSVKLTEAISWLEQYATLYGDRMPDLKKVMLPYKTEKFAVFLKYRQETKNSVSKSSFYSIWKDYFPHLKIKEMNSFSKCTTCTFLEKQLEKCLLPHKRRRMKELRFEHNQRQMFERQYYYSKRTQSKSSPSEFLSLIVDGMDQSKSNLPHFTGRLPKVINPADLLKTHITGVIDHGRNHFLTFVDVGQFPHDPNLTINIILRALKKHSDVSGNKLPPTCYIQADNCWRENKNKYVMAFCELLVREKIFNEIHLSFLMVGHTHEDVDAQFSKIASSLQTTGCDTLDDLMSVLPNSEFVDHMFNVKGWLEEHLNQVAKHTEPLHFKFVTTDNKVHNYYKGKNKECWKEMEDSFFKTDETGEISLPGGIPSLLNENMDKIDTNRLTNQIKSLNVMFEKDASAAWWHSFIDQKLKKGFRNNRRPDWILKDLPKQMEVVPDPTDNEISVPVELNQLISKETTETQVPTLKVGEVVRVLDDADKVQALQKRHGGWSSDMVDVLGKVGKIVKIDSDGDVAVVFGQKAVVLNPACCVPAPGSKPVQLEVETGKGSTDASEDNGASGGAGPFGGAKRRQQEERVNDEAAAALAQLMAQMFVLRGAASASVGPQQLLVAASEGNASRVKSILNSKPDLVNSKFKGLTALIIASHEGNLDVVKVLVEGRADLNQREEKGNTALMAALMKKREPVALFLIEKGANVHLLNVHNRSALHAAALNGANTCLRLLIEKGCDVNQVDIQGDTAMHDAINNKNNSGVAFLCGAPNINLKICNGRGLSPLHLAAMKDDELSASKILARQPDLISKSRRDGHTPLHIAALNENMDVAKLLIKLKAPIDIKNSQGLTPLHLACHHAHLEMTQLLLEHSASVTAKDNDGDTPLHVCMMGERNSVNAGDQLLGLMLGLHIRDEDEIKERFEVACLLIKNGANVNVINNRGATPLQCGSNQSLRNAVRQFAAKQSPRATQTTAGGLFGELFAALTSLCSVCGQRQSEVTFLPCRHKVTCERCCFRVRECPLCDRIILERFGADGKRLNLMVDPCKVQ